MDAVNIYLGYRENRRADRPLKQLRLLDGTWKEQPSETMTDPVPTGFLYVKTQCFFPT